MRLSKTILLVFSLCLAAGCASTQKNTSVISGFDSSKLSKETKRYLRAADNAKEEDLLFRELNLLLSVVQTNDFDRIPAKAKAHIHLRISEIGYQMERKRKFPNLGLSIEHLKKAQKAKPTWKQIPKFRQYYPDIAEKVPFQNPAEKRTPAEQKGERKQGDAS
jgi:hypothetical protein